MLVVGIGQAAKMPQYISANAFCGLHGHSLLAAVAAKIANERLTVIVDPAMGIHMEKAEIISSTIFAAMSISRILFMTTRFMG